MRNKLVVILMILISIWLVGCGAGKTDNTDKTETLPYIEGETILVSRKDVITDLDSWRQTHYVGDKLFFGVLGNITANKPSCRRIFTASSDGTTELKLDSDKMYIWSFAADTEETIYFLSDESTEEGNEYYFSKIMAEEEYHKPVANFAECIENESCVDAAVSDKGYSVVTARGTCLMWDLQGEEMGSIPAYWCPEDMEYYEAGDFGLVNGSRDMYVFHVSGNSVYLQAVDIEKGTLGDEIVVALPTTLSSSTTVVESDLMLASPVHVYSGYEKGIYISDEEKLYSYDEVSGELSEIISWSTPGINVKRDCIREVIVDEQGVPTFYGYDEENAEGVVYHMEIKPLDEFEQKTIEIGYIRTITREVMEKYVIDFNSSQGEVAVIFKQYEDMTDLHLDLIRGDGPDILNLTGLDIDEYAEKGILENLDPYFEASDTFKKEDILPSLQEVMTRKGSVYFLFPYFTIEVLIMRNGYAEDGAITTDEFLTLTKQGDESYLCNQSEGILLDTLVNWELGQYIDWENRTCSFNDGRFAAFLENLKSANLPNAGESLYQDLTLAEQIYQSKYLAQFDCVGNAFSYREMQEAFDGYAEVIGYPNQEGKELYPIETVGLTFGINSASDQKEEAWEFLDYYIHKFAKKQTLRSDKASTFSILEETFEKQLHPEPLPGMTYSYRNKYIGEMLPRDYNLTDEDREELRNIVDKVVWRDEIATGTIGRIIEEETAYFLKGAKTAEEVADIIQSRVSIYMEE